uniref:Uncharacterized protein n=1 Tax=Rhizophora mucronata TaxID=61149 RepID=A0A2P2NU28_RHIMU
MCFCGCLSDLNFTLSCFQSFVHGLSTQDFTLCHVQEFHSHF